MRYVQYWFGDVPEQIEQWVDHNKKLVGSSNYEFQRFAHVDDPRTESHRYRFELAAASDEKLCIMDADVVLVDVMYLDCKAVDYYNLQEHGSIIVTDGDGAYWQKLLDKAKKRKLQINAVSYPLKVLRDTRLKEVPCELYKHHFFTMGTSYAEIN